MKEIILIKNGELALKGLNRSTFEAVMIKRIRRSMKSCGECDIRKAQSVIYIEPKDDSFDIDRAEMLVSKVFGIAGYSRAAVCKKDMSDICSVAKEFLSETLSTAKTFKVEGKRGDKSFPLTSPELSAELGGYLLSCYGHLKVDVKNPEVTVVCEIRDNAAYVRAGQKKGAGGIPVGTGGKAAILISGGIDSPVAAWMMAKRGVELSAIHFASPPFTSPLAEQKVKELLSKVALYAGQMPLFTVHFTEIQKRIGESCPEEFFTIIMRRFMMRISQRIAADHRCQALITGESLGQVASQTIGGLVCTDAVCNMPVFRPLIGMDKNEIVSISQKIDTFDISIRPYEDCCTVFTPKHPKTKPKLYDIEKAEAVLDIDALVEEAVQTARFEIIE
ncbi:MAG: tRNA 4-thiouridine(8) synthase ThiI [Clostridia bacterium]|nr:tRNA 4-thiouridine(8) synthase ThiI [Clostridia bacterium]